MTDFHAQNFATREGTMGDIAEGVFDLVHPKSHNLGLNRFWSNGIRLYLGKMTPAMRYTPDRLNAMAFVEVMGIGTKQALSLKDEKLAALMQWTVLGPVELFVYDSKKHRYWEAPIERWGKRIHSFGAPGAFHDGKTFRRLAARHFPCEPKDAPHVPPSLPVQPVTGTVGGQA